MGRKGYITFYLSDEGQESVAQIREYLRRELGHKPRTSDIIEASIASKVREIDARREDEALAAQVREAEAHKQSDTPAPPDPSPSGP